MPKTPRGRKKHSKKGSKGKDKMCASQAPKQTGRQKLDQAYAYSQSSGTPTDGHCISAESVTSSGQRSLDTKKGRAAIRSCKNPFEVESTTGESSRQNEREMQTFNTGTAARRRQQQDIEEHYNPEGASQEQCLQAETQSTYYNLPSHMQPSFTQKRTNSRPADNLQDPHPYSNEEHQPMDVQHSQELPSQQPDMYTMPGGNVPSHNETSAAEQPKFSSMIMTGGKDSASPVCIPSQSVKAGKNRLPEHKKPSTGQLDTDYSNSYYGLHQKNIAQDGSNEATNHYVQQYPENKDPMQHNTSAMANQSSTYQGQHSRNITRGATGRPEQSTMATQSSTCQGQNSQGMDPMLLRTTRGVNDRSKESAVANQSSAYLGHHLCDTRRGATGRREESAMAYQDSASQGQYSRDTMRGATGRHEESAMANQSSTYQGQNSRDTTRGATGRPEDSAAANQNSVYQGQHSHDTLREATGKPKESTMTYQVATYQVRYSRDTTRGAIGRHEESAMANQSSTYQGQHARDTMRGPTGRYEESAKAYQDSANQGQNSRDTTRGATGRPEESTVANQNSVYQEQHSHDPMREATGRPKESAMTYQGTTYQGQYSCDTTRGAIGRREESAMANQGSAYRGQHSCDTMRGATGKHEESAKAFNDSANQGQNSCDTTRGAIGRPKVSAMANQDSTYPGQHSRDTTRGASGRPKESAMAYQGSTYQRQHSRDTMKGATGRLEEPEMVSHGSKYQGQNSQGMDQMQLSTMRGATGKHEESAKAYHDSANQGQNSRDTTRGAIGRPGVSAMANQDSTYPGQHSHDTTRGASGRPKESAMAYQGSAYQRQHSCDTMKGATGRLEEPEMVSQGSKYQGQNSQGTDQMQLSTMIGATGSPKEPATASRSATYRGQNSQSRDPIQHNATRTATGRPNGDSAYRRPYSQEMDPMHLKTTRKATGTEESAVNVSNYAVQRRGPPINTNPPQYTVNTTGSSQPSHFESSAVSYVGSDSEEQHSMMVEGQNVDIKQKRRPPGKAFASGASTSSAVQELVNFEVAEKSEESNCPEDTNTSHTLCPYLSPSKSKASPGGSRKKNDMAHQKASEPGILAQVKNFFGGGASPSSCDYQQLYQDAVSASEELQTVIDEQQREIERLSLELEKKQKNMQQLQEMHKQEKIKSERLNHLLMKTKERHGGAVSRSESVKYSARVTDYENLFTRKTREVVCAICPDTLSEDDRKLRRKKLMRYLCKAFQNCMRRSKEEFFEMLFNEIFKPKATTFSTHDTGFAQEQERIYGFLLRTYLQNLPPGKEVQPSENLVKLCVKETITEIEKHKKHGDKDGLHKLEEFTTKAVEVAWSMLVVCPPMLIDTSETRNNPDTQNLQRYGVSKSMEELLDSENVVYTVEYYKPVLYENYTKEEPVRKGWTGVKEMWSTL